LNTFDLVAKVRKAEADLFDYSSEYRPQHRHVRSLQSDMRIIRLKVDNLKQNWTRASQSDSPDKDDLIRIEAQIEKAEAAITNLQNQIPKSWAGASKRYTELEKADKKARRNYRNNVDQAYETIDELRKVIDGADELAGFEQQLTALETAIVNAPAKEAMDRVKQSERALGKVAGTSAIKSKLSKARRALKGKNPKPEKASQFLKEGLMLYAAEVAWRHRAAVVIAPALAAYDNTIKGSIGLRLQRWMSSDQIKEIASCRSIHRDFSLQF
jgi:chromosome segregation ATPase